MVIGKDTRIDNGVNAAYESVGVVIVNWNAGTLLGRCLVGLDNQTIPPHRIVIVDNGSIDHSLCQAELSHRHVKIIRLGRNAGFAKANNVGIRALDDCAWIALLNPDAVPEPDWLEQLVTSAQAASGFTFFASRMLWAVDPTVLDGTGDIYHVSGYGWRRNHGWNALGRDTKSEEVFSACAGAALYFHTALTKIGGFDESFFCYFEDMDLGFRLRLMGHRCLYVPNAVVHHVGSATTGRHSDFSVYHGHRNLVWVYFKDMPWPLFWLYLPQHILLNLISVVWLILQGQGKVAVRAKWDALKGLPRILKERRQIQKTRRVGVWELRRVMAKGLLTPYLRRR